MGQNLIATNDGIAQANFTFSAEEANFGKAAVVAKGKDDLKELVTRDRQRDRRRFLPGCLRRSG